MQSIADFLVPAQNIVAFIVLLGALVTLHELGHFVMAKLAGVRVEEFGIGFPPRLAAIRRGETEYSLNLIPLGGFVRMLGEEDPTAVRSFASTGRWWRVGILVAGATMNLLVAVLLFTGANVAGWPKATDSEVVITLVQPGTPAAQAGLLAGDVIKEFAGRTIVQTDQLLPLVMSNLGQAEPIAVNRSGTLLRLTVTPRPTWPSDQGAMGIQINDHILKTAPVSYGFPDALYRGTSKTVQTIALTFEVPVLAIRGLIPADVARPVGPVGIYQITSQATDETAATGWWFPILSVAATISAGLGIANLLPIPGLDGGRLLFILIEAVRGRRVSPQRESMIHFIGLAFLVSMVLVVTYFDVLTPADLNLPPR